MVCPMLILENKWDLLKDESLWDFECELQRLALDLMPEFESQALMRVETDEYERLTAKHQVPMFRIVGKAS